MEVIVREIIAELAAAPILVSPEWDAVVADGSRPSTCNAKPAPTGFVLRSNRSRRTAQCGLSLTSAALPSVLGRHRAPHDLKAGSIVWAVTRLRGFLWATEFCTFSDEKALESIGKV